MTEINCAMRQGLCYALAAMYRPLITCLLAALLLAACERQPTEQKAQFFVFGTVLEVTLFAVDAATADDAFGALQADFAAAHRDWHAWEPGLLTRVNEALAAGRPAQADAAIVEMVRRSQSIEAASGGRFNPAIGALVRLWGFHTSEYPIIGPPPAAADIEKLVAQSPSSRDVRIDGTLLRSENPAVQFDFGGVAKGYAIDLACQRLRDLGIENAIVNAGGDLRAIGRHGDRPWRIAIRQPGGGIIGALEAGADEAVFTSGSYERFRADSEERYPHILDPRTGWPIEALASVTVVAAEGLLADAAATALMVAGPAEWREVAAALGLDQVLLVDSQGLVQATPAMAARIEVADGVEVVTVGADG